MTKPYTEATGLIPLSSRLHRVNSGGIATRSVFRLSLFLFTLSTLFDPADRLFGLKVPLYVLCWTLGILVCVSRRGRTAIPISLLVYTLLMITIPLLSIATYFLIDGSEPYAGFQMLKAYLFISMAILLYVTQTNLLDDLCIALTLLAASIIVVATVVLIYPGLFLLIYSFGAQYGIFSIDNRDYGSGLVLFQMYFVTSPMLALSSAYFLHRTMVSRRHKLLYGVLTLVNLGAMVLAGTRNNLMAAIVLPLALFYLHSKRKVLVAVMIGAVASVGVFVFSGQIGVLLNPAEASNRAKLGLLGDYLAVFSNVTTLLFGRGLGAYEQWTGRSYNYITELTYLEIFRNFGLLFGGVIILLLLYPIIYAFLLRRSYNEKSIIVGYALYLGMCISNPNLFSSMGMLILSVILANIALFDATAGRTGVLASERLLRNATLTTQ